MSARKHDYRALEAEYIRTPGLSIRALSRNHEIKSYSSVAQYAREHDWDGKRDALLGKAENKMMELVSDQIAEEQADLVSTIRMEWLTVIRAATYKFAEDLKDPTFKISVDSLIKLIQQGSLAIRASARRSITLLSPDPSTTPTLDSTPTCGLLESVISPGEAYLHGLALKTLAQRRLRVRRMGLRLRGVSPPPGNGRRDQQRDRDTHQHRHSRAPRRRQDDLGQHDQPHEAGRRQPRHPDRPDQQHRQAGERLQPGHPLDDGVQRQAPRDLRQSRLDRKWTDVEGSGPTAAGRQQGRHALRRGAGGAIISKRFT